MQIIATTRKHPFQFQKRNSARENKKIGKGFFWWGERARAPAGVGAELRDFLGNRFGLRRKIAPEEKFTAWWIFLYFRKLALRRGLFEIFTSGSLVFRAFTKVSAEPDFPPRPVRPIR